MIRCNLSFRGLGIFLLFGLFLVAPSVVKAQDDYLYTVIHDFIPIVDATILPKALIQATDGNFYGVTEGRGSLDKGTIFKLSPSGQFSIIHRFTGGAGNERPSDLIQATDGNIYIIIGESDTYSPGVILKMTLDGTITTFLDFSPSNNLGPYPTIIQGRDGNFYVRSWRKVFKITPDGIVTFLCATSSYVGSNTPCPPVIQATDGNLYITDYRGGAVGYGDILKITPDGTVTSLYHFTGGRDFGPLYLIQAMDGNFYGVSVYAFFKITPDGSFTLLHDFDTGDMERVVIQTKDGNLIIAGWRDWYKMTPDGTITKIFDWGDRIIPVYDLIQAADGNIYGVSPTGGNIYYPGTGLHFYYHAVFMIGKSHQNSRPTVKAGENIVITSADQATTIIEGFATDPDGDELNYRWLEEGAALTDWIPVSGNGEANFVLFTAPYLSSGQHIFTLEVSDGTISTTDEMILTINNSAPNPAPVGGGVYQIFSPVNLSGHVSDYDGDLINYAWIEDEEILFTGQVLTLVGGDPFELPSHTLNFLTIGTHTLTLRINDGYNADVAADIKVEIIDTTAPTIAPEPNQTILWPPDHKMVNIEIAANAADNSGGQVVISVIIISDEPIQGLGDGDTAPDWTAPEIDQDSGSITFQLRAERSGIGDGRIYSVIITATDESGNSSTATVEFLVPHNKIK